jgi:hypothetical protein
LVHFTVRSLAETDSPGRAQTGTRLVASPGVSDNKFTFAGGEPTLQYDLVRSREDAGIRLITRAIAKERMKPPLAETTWAGRLGRTNFAKV